ncbi:MAG: lipoyl synthase [Proteobacteria bacterium]|nr:lipoyl synthase [Pseudomonadota bacterium]
MASVSHTSPKPEWLKIRPPGGENYSRIKELLRTLKLHTVCEEAKCPNVSECWGGGTATVMLMGDTCTRACKFCHVKSGNPKGVLDPNEPVNVASAIAELKLRYVVLTSVDRDDLPDGGADHFGRTVEEIKKRSPETLVEVLIPDFQGDHASVERICLSGADVIAHNVETVERLTSTVRDRRCGYQQSLGVLKKVKDYFPKIYTKSSIMLGLGETKEEVFKAMDDLRKAGVQIVTFGQYLRPTTWHLPVEEYIHPDVFKEYEKVGLEKGFLCVPSGPLVRSSYRAAEKFLEGLLRSRAN